ncbi:MAG: zinc dependent phospholipase C family protein [Pusillimonas sp.]
MSGTFNHLLVAQEALNAFMDTDVDPELRICVAKNQKYIFLGANAPDFPYVAKHDKWGDRMHYELSSKIVNKARSLLMKLRNKDEAAFAKCFCWFLGYLSHMVVDATIHPVVKIIAGPYSESEQNKKKHRLCETHMDCYIYHEKANELPLNEAEYINDKIKTGCCPEKPAKIDCDIRKFWMEILMQVFNDSADLDPDQWFFFYSTLTDAITEESNNKISKCLAKVFDQSELMQINQNNIDYFYINHLKTPNGSKIDFLNLFDFAAKNTVEIWKIFASALNRNTALPDILNKDWNLDSGVASGENIFWRNNHVA